MHSCFRHDHWQSKAHRAWFFLCAVCLAFYGAYVLYFSQSAFLTGGVQTAAAVLWFLLFSAGLFLLFLWACPRLRPAAVQQKDSFDLPVFLGSAALALFVLGFAFLGCYPGGVSYDAANQWEQAQSGQFNNWHPVFHTLLIWLVTRVYNHYGFAVLAQIRVLLAGAGLCCRVRAPHRRAPLAVPFVRLSDGTDGARAQHDDVRRQG